jgi:hypothetical protein
MSLINEALKRTRDTSFQDGIPRFKIPENNYRVSSVDETAVLTGRSGIWVSLLVLVMAGVTVLVFSLRVAKPGVRVSEAMNVQAETSETEVSPAEPARATLVAKPTPVVIPVVTPRPERKPADDLRPDQTAITPEPPAPVPVVVSPPPEQPKFVLQGITSGPGWREAMINGYALREGDEFDGARVTSVEPRRVKLQAGDREILLRMP